MSSYPGDPELDPKVQQRILRAFGEAARLYRDGLADESRTILRSIVEVDPRFTPAQRLDVAIDGGAEVDLAELLGAVSAAAPVNADEIITRAREALEAGNHQAALELAQSLLRELPGHEEARRVALAAQTGARQSREQGRPGPAPQAPPPRQAAPPPRQAAPPPRPAEPVPPPAFADDEDLFTAPESSRGEAPYAVKPPQEVSQRTHPAEDSEFEFDLDASAPAAHIDEAWEAPADAGEPLPPESSDAPGTPAMTFEQGAGEVGFGEGRDDTWAQEGVEAAADQSDGEDRVAELLERGQEAFDRDDFQEAIDTWSRIFLVDAHHAEAESRIELARSRREEVERRAEHAYYEAREAFERGDPEEARRLCAEALEMQPQHLEAHDLLQRLETPSAPPPPPVAPPDGGEGGEDIFRDDFVPETIRKSQELDEEPEPPAGATARRPSAVGRGLKMSLPTMVIATVGALAVAAVVLVVGGGIFSSRNGAASEVLEEAHRLATAGRYQEAITLLRAAEVEGDLAAVVSQRILEYSRELKSLPTPIPGVDTNEIRQAIANGNRVRAMQLVAAGLEETPRDPALEAIEQELTAYSPVLPEIVRAAGQGKWRVAREKAQEALEAHDGDPDLEFARDAATFNLALQLLHRYEIATAHGMLAQLAAARSDPEVTKLVAMAGNYLSRPVDPRYEIFLDSVDQRRIDR